MPVDIDDVLQKLTSNPEETVTPKIDKRVVFVEESEFNKVF